jgi:uncharacterized protein YaaQ
MQHTMERNLDQEVNILLGAVIQIQDLRPATRALEKLGIQVIHLPSTGAFLGRRNVTLLIAISQERLQEVLATVKETCHKRVEYISTPLEGAPMPIPLSSPITVGGAVIFAVEIEHFEEL